MSRTVLVRSADGDHRVEIDGSRILVDGHETVVPPRVHTAATGDVRWVFLDGEVYELEVQRGRGRRATTPSGSLSAPMPATVVRVNVSPGATVKKGETLLVLEAMKMELPIRAM